MLTVDVRSRVEPELKREAAAILKASGLDVSTAIRDAKAGKTTRTTLEDF